MSGLPRHIAIIMDGNGRWARKRKMPRIMGHRSGAKTVDVITEECARMGIEALTLYAFSTENWKRPKEEVEELMRLLKKSLKDNAAKLKRNNILFKAIGRIDELSDDLRREIRSLTDDTKNNSGMVFTLAINYGGRQEIVDAAKAAYEKAEKDGKDITSLTEDDFGKYLYTCGLPDPDLVIRTSGEMRLSNFLLWQAAYAEFYATDTLWPDFNAEELKKAISAYESRKRRFGG